MILKFQEEGVNLQVELFGLFLLVTKKQKQKQYEDKKRKSLYDKNFIEFTYLIRYPLLERDCL